MIIPVAKPRGRSPALVQRTKAGEILIPRVAWTIGPSHTGELGV